MSEWSVSAVSTLFAGSVLNEMGKILNLDPKFIDHFIQQHKELTSPLPLVEGVSQKFAMAHADHSSSFTPSAGVQNSGRGPEGRG
jgi:hypothetical protein